MKRTRKKTVSVTVRLDGTLWQHLATRRIMTGHTMSKELANMLLAGLAIMEGNTAIVEEIRTATVKAMKLEQLHQVYETKRRNLMKSA